MVSSEGRESLGCGEPRQALAGHVDHPLGHTRKHGNHLVPRVRVKVEISPFVLRSQTGLHTGHLPSWPRFGRLVSSRFVSGIVKSKAVGEGAVGEEAVDRAAVEKRR